MIVMGVDPGSQKVGIAVLSRECALARRIVAPSGLLDAVRELIIAHGIEAIVLGSGTRSDAVGAQLEELRLPIHLVDESRSTLDARKLYFEANPPRGWRRLLPRGMLFPPCPIDDFAAELIARRYLARQG
ncbi:MAG TPA: Holliday junction resolvase RuvX [Candidatus Dormibacteraeota bacterium]|nr:Holliday junction resolvase RuvX [Candidatus Dormibacteraeota bacterium]